MKILHYDYCDQIVTMIIIITILSKYAQSFSKVVKNKLKSFKKVFSLKKTLNKHNAVSEMKRQQTQLQKEQKKCVETSK